LLSTTSCTALSTIGTYLDGVDVMYKPSLARQG
jgi:hypothetical protein